MDSGRWSMDAEQSLTWRGKHSASTTWLHRWKRGDWIQHLSTRTFTDSLGDTIEDWWIFSVAACRANRSRTMEVATASKIRDTFGLPSVKESTLFDQPSSSLKTSAGLLQPNPMDTSQFSTMSAQTWSDWVTRRQQDCLQRVSLGRAKCESDGSSSLWPTPTTAEGGSSVRALGQGLLAAF